MIRVTFFYFIIFIVNYGYCQFPELLNLEYGIGEAIANTAAKYVICGRTNGLDEGLCMHSFECYARGGATNWVSTCPFGKKCCIFSNGCTTRRIRERISYFTSLNTLTSNNRLCQLNIEPINDNICQYRLDFISFNLQPPENSVCTKEHFNVIPETDIIPPLCGNNDGQHLYVHTNPGSNIQLNMNIGSGSTSTWKIKITQIECPGVDGFWAKHHLNYNITSLLAPVGCTQYFTERSGIIQSFAFGNNIENSFIANQHYAICFAKNIGQNNLRLSVLDRAVIWPSATCPPTGNTNMYLYFPSETMRINQNGVGVVVSYVCMLPIETILTSNTPGPFVIVVKSLNFVKPTTPNSIIGFRFSYAF